MTAFLAELHRGVLDKRHSLDRDLTIIGRDDGVDIRVDDGSTSRKHAQIELRKGRFYLRDLGSRNGTTVNELHLVDGEHELVLNDCIFIGKSIFCFLIAEEKHRGHTTGELDPITHLPSLESFHRKLDRAMQQARGEHRTLALLLVGIDDLHGINEDHGTERGDDVLRVVARRLGGALREPEKAGRLRGGVFGVIAPDLLDGSLLERCEQLRKRIEEATVRPGDPPIAVNVSIGAAAMLSLDRERLCEAADGALSRAKQRGSSVERASRDPAAETDRFKLRLVPASVFSEWCKPPLVGFVVRLSGVEPGRQSPIDVDLQSTVQKNLTGDELATFPKQGGSVLITLPLGGEARVQKLSEAIRSGFDLVLAKRGHAPVALTFTKPFPIRTAAAATMMLHQR